MRYFFLTLVLLVLGWFGYGFLTGKGVARAAGEDVPLGGEVLSTVPLSQEKDGSLPSFASGRTDLSSTAEGKKSPSPKAPLEAALGALEGSLKSGDLKAFTRLVKEGAGRYCGNPRFRSMALKGAEKALETGALERSARILTEVLDLWTRGPLKKEEQAELMRTVSVLDRVMSELLFSPGGAWRSRTWVVKRGDVLERIARRFRKAEGNRVTPGFIEAVNRITAKQLRPGQKLRIPLGRLHVVVEKKSFVLKLFLDDILVRVYRVGLGKDGKTPSARFNVLLKQKNPVWWHPTRGPIPHGHPDNPLGDYFIKLQSDKYTGFGIHGTKPSERDTIGKEASQGCIRMLSEDVKELFSLLPKGAEVLVR